MWGLEACESCFSSRPDVDWSEISGLALALDLNRPHTECLFSLKASSERNHLREVPWITFVTVRSRHKTVGHAMGWGALVRAWGCLVVPTAARLRVANEKARDSVS